jgi:hypothetical protein
MNSMLATLNTRQHIRDRAFDQSNGWNSIPIGALNQSITPEGPQPAAGNPAMAVGDFNQFDTASVSVPGRPSFECS